MDYTEMRYLGTEGDKILLLDWSHPAVKEPISVNGEFLGWSYNGDKEAIREATIRVTPERLNADLQELEKKISATRKEIPSFRVERGTTQYPAGISGIRITNFREALPFMHKMAGYRLQIEKIQSFLQAA